MNKIIKLLIMGIMAFVGYNYVMSLISGSSGSDLGSSGSGSGSSGSGSGSSGSGSGSSGSGSGSGMNFGQWDRQNPIVTPAKNVPFWANFLSPNMWVLLFGGDGK